MRERTMLLLLVLVAVLGGLAAGTMAQATSSASSSASSTGGTAEVRLGGFVFEAGARIALEIVHEGDGACFGANVAVERVQLIDAAGAVLYAEDFVPAAGIDAWIGRIHLVDPAGAPFPMGVYEILVSTGAGPFVAEIEIAPQSQLFRLGRFSASASICGYSLRVYRLLTKLDDGAAATLRIGDRLMVALAGNPTTGYSWFQTIEAEFASLQETEEVEYRATSSLIGSGGTFVFRYIAVTAGPRMLRMAYQRPWESTAPSEVVTFTIDVH